MEMCPRHCPDRAFDCHGSCEEYKKKVLDLDKRKQYLRSFQDLDTYRIETGVRLRKRNNGVNYRKNGEQ